ncbi:hypothetical protein [Natronorubrum aibiense]|uniref:Uncharacterized protein n=1 Tax=Natronorubrum aibiense TaxID=348826 RepID=A0A5P9P6X1_9EURY|nr:hypothetical protein [Natronorubrum aibiense]QFU83909.1 hypothetical protein GCU68_15880 [Natronorubrum aibiense]
MSIETDPPVELLVVCETLVELLVVDECVVLVDDSVDCETLEDVAALLADETVVVDCEWVPSSDTVVTDTETSSSASTITATFVAPVSESVV